MGKKTSVNETKTDDLLQLVVFQLAGEEFGVDIMKVQEIIRLPDITRLPQSPGYVEGVINLRGKIIVVVNLNIRFNLRSKDMDENSRIVIVEVGGNVIGMIVDSVTEVLRLPVSNVEPAPEMISMKLKADYLKGVGKLADRLLILLDLGLVLHRDEINKISALGESML